MAMAPPSRHPTGVQRRTLRAFRNPSYRLLWPANLLSYSARWMQMTILGWFVLQHTDSPWLVALVGFFGSAPMLALGLVGGYLADSAYRKTVMVATQAAGLAASIVMLSLLITGSERFWHAYPIVMVTGIAWALDMPSRRSSIYDLLGSSGVTNGIALDSVGMSVSRMAGPALAGALILVAGFKGAYVAVTVSYVLSLTLVLKFSVVKRIRSEDKVHGVLSSILVGLKYVAGHPTLRAAVSITVLMNFLMFPYMHLVPVIARDVLHVGPGSMGVLMAASGMGALVGAVLVASASNIRDHGRLYMGGSLLAFAALLVFALSGWYFLSMPALLVLGLGTAGFSTMQASIVMLVAGEDMRGQALGVVSLAIGASPLGALLEGGVADRVSPGFALALNAILGAVLIGLIALLMPSLRERMEPDSRRGDT